MLEILKDGLSKIDISLPTEILKQEILYLEELLRWNRQINLTAIRIPQEALEKHLVDSLALLAYLPKTAWLLDMGSGGGLPGIPLAIARPGINLVSVDSVGKKISFQKHIKRRLNLDNLYPVHTRLAGLAETNLPIKGFDLAVTRAFSSLEQMLQLAGPWLKEGGQVIAMKGPEGESELRMIENRLIDFGFSLMAIERNRLPFSGAERQYIQLKRICRR